MPHCGSLNLRATHTATRPSAASRTGKVTNYQSLNDFVGAQQQRLRNGEPSRNAAIRRGSGDALWRNPITGIACGAGAADGSAQMPPEMLPMKHRVCSGSERQAGMTNSYARWSDLDSRTQFHHAIGGNVEEVRDAPGVACHRDKDTIAPRRHPFLSHPSHNFLPR